MNAEHKLLIYRDKKGLFRWRMVSPNGNVLADSGQGYKRKENLLKGWDSLWGACVYGTYFIDNVVMG